MSALRVLALAAIGVALAQPVYRPAPGRPWMEVEAHGDLEAALQRAAARLPDHGRIALRSDGFESRGSLLRAAHELNQRDIAIYYAYEPPSPEVALVDLQAPARLQPGAPFALEVTVAATEPTAATLTLDAEVTREEQLPAGESVLRIELTARAGETRYQLTLTPHGADTDPSNNTLALRVRASDQPRVLLLDSEPAWTDAFATVLRSAGFEVETRGSDPDAFDFVILSDMPASGVPLSLQRALTQYVRGGGGLLIAGGEHAYGPGGYRGSALERLLPVSLQGADARNEASLALVLAIDKSGSMAGEKLERAKEAALATAALLPTDAYLGVIGFDVEATRIVRFARARADLSAIARLGAGGGTALFPALDAAYADLAPARAQLKHVVVLTDGQTQEEALGDLVRAMHADGITISTIGLGEDVQRGLLSELAKLARGRAYLTRDPSQIPRLFVEETERVARSLVVERPVRVRQVASASFLRGIAIATAPPLRGFVSTHARATTLLASGDAPILARMRVGEGWSLAWTSDLKPRWAAPWFAWPSFGPLFAQLVREHMRRADPLALRTRFQDGVAELSCEVLDDRGRFVNGLTGTVEAEQGSAPLEQVAPGRYLARIAAAPGSALRVRLGDRRASATVPAARIPLGSGRALLERAAQLTGGGAVPSGPLPSVPPDEPRPLWPAALWVALGAFLADLTRRRLRRYPGA